MSSLLESLMTTESGVYDNSDINEVISELAHLQEKCEVLPGELQFTPDMVPVVKLEGCGPDGEDKYCIDAKHFQKMIKSEKMGITDGVHTMFDKIKYESNIEGISDMAIVVAEENLDDLYDMVTQEPSKLNMRLESVAKHVDFINTVLETGCSIFLK